MGSQDGAFELADIIAWKTIRATTVSHEGQWFGYRLGPGKANAQVILRQTAGNRELAFDIGEPPVPLRAKHPDNIVLGAIASWVTVARVAHGAG